MTTPGITATPTLPPLDETVECVVCYNEIPATDKLKCGHAVCSDCLKQIQKPICPICQKPLEGPLVTPEILQAAISREESTKAEKLTLQLLQAEQMAENPEYNPNAEYGVNPFEAIDNYQAAEERAEAPLSPGDMKVMQLIQQAAEAALEAKAAMETNPLFEEYKRMAGYGLSPRTRAEIFGEQKVAPPASPVDELAAAIAASLEEERKAKERKEVPAPISPIPAAEETDEDLARALALSLQLQGQGPVSPRRSPPAFRGPSPVRFTPSTVPQPIPFPRAPSPIRFVPPLPQPIPQPILVEVKTPTIIPPTYVLPTKAAIPPRRGAPPTPAPIPVYPPAPIPVYPPAPIPGPIPVYPPAPIPVYPPAPIPPQGRTRFPVPPKRK